MPEGMPPKETNTKQQHPGRCSTLKRNLYDRVFKRGFDLILGVLLFFVLLIPGTLIALLIRMDSPGGVFYLQTRVGRDGKPFRMFKFRSMVEGAERMGAGVLVEENDQVPTAFGENRTFHTLPLSPPIPLPS